MKVQARRSFIRSGLFATVSGLSLDVFALCKVWASKAKEESREVISWIAKNLPMDNYVNIMSQYRPLPKAGDYIFYLWVNDERDELISNEKSIDIVIGRPIWFTL